MEIILINEELFRENSPIKEDAAITKFVPYISLAQKMHIEPILGKPLTDELKKQIKEASKEGGGGIDPTYQALILKIAPSLSFYAVYQGLPFHWASIVNKGITLRESENSGAVSISDISQLRRWVKDDAEELSRDLIEYLCSCRENYPLWKPRRDCECSKANEGSAESTFDAGIFIPKRR